MTATRDHSDLDHWGDAPDQDQRAAFGTRRGLPWWGAVLLGFVPAAIGVFIDIERVKQLGFVFIGLYFLGCVAAVLLVQRRSVFGAMVQPPLIVAISVPLVVLVAVGTPKGGISAKAIAAGTPLINAFPTMAATTAVALIIGIVRIFTQRQVKEPEPAPRPRPPAPRGNRQPPRPPTGRRPAPGQGRPVPPGGQAAGRGGAPREGQGGRPPARRPRQQPPQQGRQAGGQPPRRQPRQPRPFDQQDRPRDRQGRPGGSPRRPEPPRWDDLGHNDDFYTD